MIGSLVGIHLNRSPDHLNSDLVPAALMLHHPEQMQAIWMLGVERENLAINGFRFGQSPRSVVPESFLQRVLNE